jgi:hypothetical protein
LVIFTPEELTIFPSKLSSAFMPDVALTELENKENASTAKARLAKKIMYVFFLHSIT